jgi:LacI family transcriptional regulator
MPPVPDAPPTPSAAPVTIRDIARACGVSKTTVSVALYGDKPIKSATRQQIIDTALAMGYHLEQQSVARRLALRKSRQPVVNRVLTYFTPLDFTHGAYAREPYRGLAAVCHQEQFAVLLTESTNYLSPAETLAALPGVFGRGDVDGAILSGEAGPLAGVLRDLPGFGARPIVQLFLPEPGASCVLSDDRQGTEAATRHLLALGHRHLLYLYDPPASAIVISRLAGIHTALRAAGLEPTAHLSNLVLPTQLLNPQLAPHVLPHAGAPAQDVTLGADLLLPYLQAHPEITAIFCENDAMALNLWHMLHNAGLHVPEDISLIGFDDTDGMLDATGVNHLTTIRLPLYDMGVAAAELLIGRITGQLPADEQRVLPVEFIPRHSTAPARPRSQT